MLPLEPREEQLLRQQPSKEQLSLKRPVHVSLFIQCIIRIHEWTKTLWILTMFQITILFINILDITVKRRVLEDWMEYCVGGSLDDSQHCIRQNNKLKEQITLEDPVNEGEQSHNSCIHVAFYMH